MKLAYSLHDYDVINDSWFLIFKTNGYLVAFLYRFHVLEKQKLIKTNSQTDHVTWDEQRHVKVKYYEKWQLKLKYHLYTEKKVLYFKESLTFQSKCCILKKVLC